jgi:hypothetical protein
MTPDFDGLPLPNDQVISVIIQQTTNLSIDVPQNNGLLAQVKSGTISADTSSLSFSTGDYRS